jgi:hypothetical protein
MTTTQIASMNPIARTTSIFNSLPAEIFCSRLGSFYDKAGGRTIPIHAGHPPQCRSGEAGIQAK